MAKANLIPALLSLTFLLVVGGFSRLWQIKDYQIFLGDEGRDALVMRHIMTGRHYPLIGPGTSIGNMYLGPLYYYLVAPSLLLSGFSPVGPAVFVAVIGILTIILLYYLASHWFGSQLALGIATLYALSPTVIVYSRSSWNPNIMPFFALLTVIFVWKVWRFNNWQVLPLVAISMAFVLNSHYLGLLLVPLILLFVCLSLRKNLGHLKYPLLISTASLVLFSVLMSPLLFFDLRHNFQNSQAIKDFFSKRQATVSLKPYKAIPNLWPVWRDIVSSLLSAKNPPLTYWVSFGLLDLTLLYALRKRNQNYWLVISWLGIGILGLSLYKQHIYDHYYGFLFPAPFLLLGFILKFLSHHKVLKLLGLASLLIILSVSIYSSPLKQPPNFQVGHTQAIANFIAAKSAGQPFNLALIAKSNYDASYRYFFDIARSPLYTIHDQLTDQLFVICEDNPCTPIGHPLWEVAAFGWAKQDSFWDFPWGVKVYRLIHNPEGKS